MRIVFCTIIFVLCLPVFAADELAPVHICYFSLNNEKEYGITSDFLDKLNKSSPRKITISEYQMENDNPQESFQNLVSSGQKCDGLVISGHHTGSFGGKRAAGTLGINFMEELACDPLYSDWFAQVKALWLQGCRTLGDKVEGDVDADYHMFRVGAVLDEDHLEQGFSDLNIEFSDTLDQDNPLSSRYMRAFPRATVFGWTKTAPGEKARSELSLLYHMAHMARLMDDREEFFENPLMDFSESTAIKYSMALLSLLERTNAPDNRISCFEDEQLITESWRNHGRGGQYQYAFSNPDLQAFPSLYRSDNDTLKLAKKMDCLLKNTEGDDLANVIEQILSNPKMIGYSFNTIWEKLKSLEIAGDFATYDKLAKLIVENPNMQTFLMAKLASKELGLIRKIDYYAFYRDISGEDFPAIENQIIDNAISQLKKFSEDPENYDLMDYAETLLASLFKNKIIADKETLKEFLNRPSVDDALLSFIAKQADQIEGMQLREVFDAIWKHPKKGKETIPKALIILANIDHPDIQKIIDELLSDPLREDTYEYLDVYKEIALVFAHSPSKIENRREQYENIRAKLKNLSNEWWPNTILHSLRFAEDRLGDTEDIFSDMMNNTEWLYEDNNKLSHSFRMLLDALRELKPENAASIVRSIIKNPKASGPFFESWMGDSREWLFMESAKSLATIAKSPEDLEAFYNFLATKAGPLEREEQFVYTLEFLKSIPDNLTSNAKPLIKRIANDFSDSEEMGEILHVLIEKDPSLPINAELLKALEQEEDLGDEAKIGVVHAYFNMDIDVKDRDDKLTKYLTKEAATNIDLAADHLLSIKYSDVKTPLTESFKNWVTESGVMVAEIVTNIYPHLPAYNRNQLRTQNYHYFDAGTLSHLKAILQEFLASDNLDKATRDKFHQLVSNIDSHLESLN